MYFIQIEIPTQATDSNRILGVNKFVKHKLFERIKREIALLTHGKTPGKPLERFDISVTRYGAKYLDYDNFIASLKPYIDGLKLAGIIKDDNWSFIRYIQVNQETSRDKKLIISVTERASLKQSDKHEIKLS